jgi:hypothetical protein
MITICKATLSGAAPAQLREQTEGLVPGGLRDLAVKLAADPALMVSVITYADGTQELEVLHAGPPPAGEITDRALFARLAGQVPAQTLPIAGPPDVQHAATLVRTIVLADAEE